MRVASDPVDAQKISDQRKRDHVEFHHEGGVGARIGETDGIDDPRDRADHTGKDEKTKVLATDRSMSRVNSKSIIGRAKSARSDAPAIFYDMLNALPKFSNAVRPKISAASATAQMNASQPDIQSGRFMIVPPEPVYVGCGPRSERQL